MGRLLKRVPLDFKWPMHAIWKGYINPYKHSECPFCKGEGYTIEMQNKIEEIKSRNYITEYEYDFLSKNHSEYLNGLSLIDLNIILSDSVNRNTKTLAIYYTEYGQEYLQKDMISIVLATEELEKLGIPIECEECHGLGYMFPSDEFYELAENWEHIEPPTGPGFQLWENTSEGSPISPVFETIEEFAEYAETNCSIFGNNKLSKEQWLDMFKRDKDMLFYEQRLNDDTSVVFF